jgi:hypothetical protein
VTDEEWKKFSSNFQKSGSSGSQSVGGMVGSAALGLGEGALKQVVGQADPKGGLLLSPEHAKAARDWAASKDPDRPMTEGAGRFATDIAPAFIGGPELGLGKLAASARPMLKYGAKLAEDTWQGALGGAEQNTKDPGEGAGTGAVGGAALGALPRVPRVAVPAAAAASMLSHGHHFHFGPWAYYHLLGPLTALAHFAQRMGPGPTGAVLEKADRARLHEGGQSDDWSPSKGNQ